MYTVFLVSNYAPLQQLRIARDALHVGLFTHLSRLCLHCLQHADYSHVLKQAFNSRSPETILQV